VSVEKIEQEFSAPLVKVKEFGFTYNGAVPATAIPASDSESWKKVTAAWKSGTPVWRDPRSGDFYLGSRKPAGTEPLRKPKVGLYRSWVPSMDEGWTRWILEQFGWEYEPVGNAQIRAGDLAARFDVLLFADQSAGTISNGFRQGAMPEEYTGGLGPQGAEALQKFTQAGGRLIFLNESGEYAPEALGAKVKDALKGISNKDVYSPGSLLNVRLEPGHPLGLGLPAEFTVWNEQSPVWEPEEGAGRAVVRYSQAPVLASGWLLGEKYMAGKPALVELRAGSGKIVLFGMRPQYRAQSYLTLKLLFNALVY